MATNFGTANDFNIFVFGDHIQSNVDSEGRVAVGGSAIYSNYAVSAELPISTVRADLIVGESIDIVSGENHGNTFISTSGTVIQYTMTNVNGVPNQPLVGDIIDFEAEEAYLTCASAEWGALPLTGTAEVQFGQLVLTGNDSNLNIFAIDGTNIAGSGLSLSQLNGINIVAPIGSTILINIFGDNIGFGSYSIFRNGVAASGEDGEFIVWNFPEATSLFQENISVKGAILAPLSNYAGLGGNIEGNIMSGSFEGSAETHNFLFQGELPEVCSPTSTTTTTSTSTSTTTSSSTTFTTTTSFTTSSSTSTTTTTTSPPCSACNQELASANEVQVRLVSETPISTTQRPFHISLGKTGKGLGINFQEYRREDVRVEFDGREIILQKVSGSFTGSLTITVVTNNKVYVSTPIRIDVLQSFLINAPNDIPIHVIISSFFGNATLNCIDVDFDGSISISISICALIQSITKGSIEITGSHCLPRETIAIPCSISKPNLLDHISNDSQQSVNEEVFCVATDIVHDYLMYDFTYDFTVPSSDVVFCQQYKL